MSRSAPVSEDEPAAEEAPAAGEPPTGRRRWRWRPTTRRGWIIAALVTALVLGGGGVGTWWLLGRSQGPTTTTRTLTLEPTTLKQTVSATGTLEPTRTANLTFSSSGTVTAVNVAVGDTVTTGESLAAIDPASLQIALASARADLTAAKETLADLQDSDGSAAAIKSATATVQVKTNAVTQAESNLASATLTAPFDGVVAEVNVATGDQAGSSSSSGSTAAGGSGSSGSAAAGGTGTSTSSSTSSAAIVVISQGTYTVSTSVSSSDIASVKRGLQAEITVSGVEKAIYGTVSSVAVNASADSTSSTASFPVTIDVTGTQDGLFAGSSVTAQIVTAQYTDVIAVSATALTQTNGATTVSKLVDGVATPTTVTTGATVDGSVIITQGLAEGDQIQVTTASGRSNTSTGTGTQSSDEGAPSMQGGYGGSGGFQPPSGQGGMSGSGMGPNR